MNKIIKPNNIDTVVSATIIYLFNFVCLFFQWGYKEMVMKTFIYRMAFKL